MQKTRIVIMGAAGRDFHNFNTVYRENPTVDVVAFTAAQITGIANRTYPPELAGPHYPQGIPILDESELESLCRRHAIDQVVFAYSDLTHIEVMHRASRALACGADFILLGPHRTMLKSCLPVIAVSAVRTGCGKSQTARWLSALLKAQGLRVAVIRHPMPYGTLAQQAVQRFATYADLDTARCTIEEREEYEPHLAQGSIVFAGVDYARILQQAEQEADLLLWDGGNNDFPFFAPDLHIVLADALRPGHETRYHPGETVLRMADHIVIAKSDHLDTNTLQNFEASLHALNPTAPISRARSIIHIDGAPDLRGKKVIVVEDGPTLTHGGMRYGAGYVAAQQAGAIVIDPRPYAAPEIAAAYTAYPHIGHVLPALGYSSDQLSALKTTLMQCPAEYILSASPINLGHLLALPRVVRVRYDFAEASTPGLEYAITTFLQCHRPGSPR
jgi:predicted GTPase